VAPLWLEGGGASSGAGLYRANYSQPLLSISGSERLYVHGLTFEDALWPSCFPRLAPPRPNKPMISVTSAAAVVFANCTFLRGFNIGVAISASHHIAFSHNTWLESQTFGVWVNDVGKYSSHVHFFGNKFLHGRNNAFIGTLSNSSFQGNDFVHNHHVACFNQSGGQLDINQKTGPNTNLAIAANRVVDGSITGGDSGQDWHRLSTQAFEIHNGIHVFLLHNDAYNNSGWSTKPNPKNWPNGANITLEANRMCSRCGHARGLTHTVCTGKENPSPPDGLVPAGTKPVAKPKDKSGPPAGWCNATDEPWVHRVGEQDRQCEANSNGHGICGDSHCNAPVRPRGWLQAGTAANGRRGFGMLYVQPPAGTSTLCELALSAACPEPMGASLCRACAGADQHVLRMAGCSASDVQWWCSGGQPTPPPGGTPVSWSVADLDPNSVRVLRNFSLSAVPEPMAVPDAQRGKSGRGSEMLHDVPSIVDGGEMVALWAEGYGVLDVTLVASQDTQKSVF